MVSHNVQDAQFQIQGDLSNLVLKNNISTYLIFFILWFIWMARNNMKHKSSEISFKGVIIWINNYIRKAVKNGILLEKHFTGTKLEFISYGGELKQSTGNWRCIFWKKSEEGVVKINVDGSFDERNIGGGVGGIFRNSHGDCLLYFSAPAYGSNALHNEAITCLFALKIARLQPLQRFLMETDSLLLIQQIVNKKSIPWYIHHLFRKIWKLSNHIQICFTHTYREANKVADFLARRGMLENKVILSQ